MTPPGPPRAPSIPLTQAGLVVLILTAFFSGGLIGLKLIPPQTAWITEIVIAILAFDVLRQKRELRQPWQVAGGRFAIGAVAISVISAAVAEGSPVSVLLFLRLQLRFYLLMLVLMNSSIDEPAMRRMNLLIAALFVLQIPVAVVKLFIYGQGERAIGTYAYASGGNSTVIPMLAAAFLMAYHFIHRRSPRHLLLGVAFVAFGIIGGKRGIIVLIPVVVILTYQCIRWTLNLRGLSHRTVVMVLSVLVSSLLSFYAVARCVPRLNPDHRFGGRFSASFAWERVTERLETTPKDGVATDRARATAQTWRYLRQKGTVATLIGRGPGSIMKSIFSGYDRDFLNQVGDLGIVYGMTGLTWLLLQVGVIGTALWLGFFLNAFLFLRRAARAETDTYWRAFDTAMMSSSLIVILVSCVYNTQLLFGDLSAFAYMVLLAFAARRYMLRTEGARP